MRAAADVNAFHPISIVDNITEEDIEQGLAYRLSFGCSHVGSADTTKRVFVTDMLTDGKSLKCPLCPIGCGLVSSTHLKSLAHVGLLTEDEAASILLIRVRELEGNFEQELEIAQYYQSGAKQCPFCFTWHMHYNNHGCHHISPRTGCTVCNKHFCYNCLFLSEDEGGLAWSGCATCPGSFCDDVCLCPLCPECKPGNSCPRCEYGGCPACVQPLEQP